jgi:hypothetical protein
MRALKRQLETPAAECFEPAAPNPRLQKNRNGRDPATIANWKICAPAPSSGSGGAPNPISTVTNAVRLKPMRTAKLALLMRRPCIALTLYHKVIEERNFAKNWRAVIEQISVPHLKTQALSQRFLDARADMPL